MLEYSFKMTRRGLLATSAAAGTMALLNGLPAMAQGSTLTVAVQGLPDSLITGFSSFASLNILYQMVEPLVLMDAAGNPAPGLATSWTAEGADTWRLNLRKGVTFHDGHPFTAADVKFTLDYVIAPNSLYGSKARVSQITNVDIIDDFSVRIKTKGPFPTLINGLNNVAIEPKHYVEAVGRDKMTAAPIGTGPFKLAKWVPGDRIEFTANDSYWGGKPAASNLVIRQVPEGSTRVATLLAKEVAISEELPIDLLSTVDESKDAAVVAVESTVGLLLTFDTRKPPFNDARVRQAMNLAIDKQAILERLLMGRGTVLQGQMLTSNTFGFNPDVKAFPYDPEKAKKLLAEAGYPKGFKTAITTRSGKYLADVEICNVCAAMFAEIGVETAVNVVEQGVFSKMTTAMDMGPMHMVGWYSLGDADFATVWFTEGGKRAFWKNDEFEKLFVDARSTVDDKARLAAYHRMTQIMHDEAPAVYLFGLPTIYGKLKKLTNWNAPADKVMHLATAAVS